MALIVLLDSVRPSAILTKSRLLYALNVLCQSQYIPSSVCQVAGVQLSLLSIDSVVYGSEFICSGISSMLMVFYFGSSVTLSWVIRACDRPLGGSRGQKKGSWILVMRHIGFFLQAMNITVGVLALQGAFQEHLALLKKASESISSRAPEAKPNIIFSFREVRTAEQLALCDALIIPGGESTTISLVAARSNLLEPLRDFVK